MKHKFRCVVATLAYVLTVGGGLATQATAQDGAPKNQEEVDPSTGSQDIDTTVLYPMYQVRDAAKKALATYGCDVKKEKKAFIECTRSKHFGAESEAGGEKVTVRLSEKGSETRVKIKTGKGSGGRLGKKNWSTPVFDEMLKTLKSGGQLDAQSTAASKIANLVDSQAEKTKIVKAGPKVIPEATQVKVRLEQSLSSATAEVGQPVQIVVSDDVMIDGAVAIARNSVVNGTIVIAQKKRRMGRTGKLDFSIDNNGVFS